LTKYRPFDDNPNYGPIGFIGQPTVLYGSWNWLNKCKRQFTPGALGMSNNLDCNVYYNYIPREWLLNGKNIVTTFGQFYRNPNYFYQLLNTEELFIRPMSGFKTFTGFVANIDEISYELNASMQLTSVTPETYIMLAVVKQINSEFRFLIVNGEVVDGSMYRLANKRNIQNTYPEGAFKLAHHMSQLPWQPDAAYTCDVASTPNGFLIIELNSFACAGMYGMNKSKVIDAINQQALREWSN
jgi:hypothetical protein